jgi:hypothetical protein
MSSSTFFNTKFLIFFSSLLASSVGFSGHAWLHMSAKLIVFSGGPDPIFYKNFNLLEIYYTKIFYASRETIFGFSIN